MKHLLIIAILLTIPYSAKAETFHPSRVRLLVHGSYQLNEVLQLQAHLIPAGNLLAGLAPISYLGVNYKPTNWLAIELDTGWNFKADEILFSVKPCLEYKKFWLWAEVDAQFPSYSGYWFVQVQYKITGWLHAGIEGEGWGNFSDSATWSHGGGPNLLFRLGKHVGVDLTIHARDLPNDDIGVRPEFFLRTHLFF
jgi:hypothetical protein